MRHYQAIVLSCIIYLIVWVIPLSASEGDPVPFTQDQAGKMAAEISDGRTAVELNTKYEALIEEFKTQVKTAEAQTDIVQKKYDLATEQIEINKKLSADLDQARLNEIKDLKKPRWGSLFGSFGVGAATALGIVLLFL